MGLIYMRTSPSGKSYIGQTLTEENKRWKQHCLDAFNNKRHEYNSPLCKAIRKYGEENFTVQILEDNIPNNLLDEKEIYYISLYKTRINGYNQTIGGSNFTKISDKDILDLWDQGYSSGEIANLLKVNPNTISYRMKTLIPSHEIRSRGAYRSCQKKEKPIIQIDLNENFIKEWTSAGKAGKELNIDSSGITKVCKNKRQSAGGYKWKYKN